MSWQATPPDEYISKTDGELEEAIEARRRELGDDLLILGHHFQREAMIKHADLTGDSLVNALDVQLVINAALGIV